MKEIFTTVHLLLCLIGPSTVCNQPRNYDMVVAGDLTPWQCASEAQRIFAQDEGVAKIRAKYRIGRWKCVKEEAKAAAA
jgi:hypothetical protein